MLIDAQLARRHAGAAMLFVGVGMFGKGNALLAQELRGGCFRDVFFFGAHETNGLGSVRCTWIWRTLCRIRRGSTTRMMFRMQFFEPLTGNVGVNLRGRNIGMPEQ